MIGGSYRPIDVEYNCVGVGEATVTLTLPFPGDNFRPAVFTWKKRCGSSPSHEFVFVACSFEFVTEPWGV